MKKRVLTLQDKKEKNNGRELKKEFINGLFDQLYVKENRNLLSYQQKASQCEQCIQSKHNNCWDYNEQSAGIFSGLMTESYCCSISDTYCSSHKYCSNKVSNYNLQLFTCPSDQNKCPQGQDAIINPNTVGNVAIKQNKWSSFEIRETIYCKYQIQFQGQYSQDIDASLNNNITIAFPSIQEATVFFIAPQKYSNDFNDNVQIIQINSGQKLTVTNIQKGQVWWVMYKPNIQKSGNIQIQVSVSADTLPLPPIPTPSKNIPIAQLQNQSFQNTTAQVIPLIQQNLTNLTLQVNQSKILNESFNNNSIQNNQNQELQNKNVSLNRNQNEQMNNKTGSTVEPTQINVEKQNQSQIVQNISKNSRDQNLTQNSNQSEQNKTVLMNSVNNQSLSQYKQDSQTGQLSITLIILILAAVLAFFLITIFCIKFIKSKPQKVDDYNKNKIELNESHSGIDLKALFNNKSNFDELNVQSQSKIDGLDDNSIKDQSVDTVKKLNKNEAIINQIIAKQNTDQQVTPDFKKSIQINNKDIINGINYLRASFQKNQILQKHLTNKGMQKIMSSNQYEIQKSNRLTPQSTTNESIQTHNQNSQMIIQQQEEIYQNIKQNINNNYYNEFSKQKDLQLSNQKIMRPSQIMQQVKKSNKKKNLTNTIENNPTTRNDRYDNDDQQKTCADINPDLNETQNPFSFKNLPQNEIIQQIQDSSLNEDQLQNIQAQNLINYQLQSFNLNSNFFEDQMKSSDSSKGGDSQEFEPQVPQFGGRQQIEVNDDQVQSKVQLTDEKDMIQEDPQNAYYNDTQSASNITQYENINSALFPLNNQSNVYQKSLDFRKIMNISNSNFSQVIKPLGAKKSQSKLNNVQIINEDNQKIKKSITFTGKQNISIQIDGRQISSTLNNQNQILPLDHYSNQISQINLKNKFEKNENKEKNKGKQNQEQQNNSENDDNGNQWIDQVLEKRNQRGSEKNIRNSLNQEQNSKQEQKNEIRIDISESNDKISAEFAQIQDHYID